MPNAHVTLGLRKATLSAKLGLDGREVKAESRIPSAGTGRCSVSVQCVAFYGTLFSLISSSGEIAAWQIFD